MLCKYLAQSIRLWESIRLTPRRALSDPVLPCDTTRSTCREFTSGYSTSINRSDWPCRLKLPVKRAFWSFDARLAGYMPAGVTDQMRAAGIGPMQNQQPEKRMGTAFCTGPAVGE